MKYFEIKPNTKEHESADRVFTWKQDWQKDDILNDFKEALGIDPIANMEMNPWVLRLDKVPEGTRHQFKKNKIDGKYEALARSELNLKYLDVIKKYDLKVFTMQEFSFQFGWGYIHALCPIINVDSHRFFLEMKPELSEESLLKFKNHPALSEVEEVDYLLLRAEMLKRKKEVE